MGKCLSLLEARLLEPEDAEGEQKGGETSEMALVLKA